MHRRTRARPRRATTRRSARRARRCRARPPVATAPGSLMSAMHHRGALGDVAPRDRPADPTARAGHQRNLSLESTHDRLRVASPRRPGAAPQTYRQRGRHVPGVDTLGEVSDDICGAARLAACDRRGARRGGVDVVAYVPDARLRGVISALDGRPEGAHAHPRGGVRRIRLRLLGSRWSARGADAVLGPRKRPERARIVRDPLRDRHPARALDARHPRRGEPRRRCRWAGRRPPCSRRSESSRSR